jgi:hypothetical protein
MIAAFVTDSSRRPIEALDSIRDTLTSNDLRTLTAYARRCVVFALTSNDPTRAVSGLQAVSLIDLGRVDRRDLTTVAALLVYAAGRTGADTKSELAAAARRSEAAVADIFDRFRRQPVTSLKEWGHRAVTTKSGVIVVNDQGRAFTPSSDLVEIAVDIADIVETGGYHVPGITTGSDFPAVWLAAAEREALKPALAAITGCISLGGVLRPERPSDLVTQWFTVFVAEAVTSDDAGQLAAAIIPGSNPPFVGFGLSSGVVLAVVIARSVMAAVEGFETEDTIDRFRQPLAELLGH